MRDLDPWSDPRQTNLATSPMRAVKRGVHAIGFALAAWILTGGCALAGDRAKAKIEYNRDVRPILAENCFACHGPDSAARKGDLRLDKREAAIEAGAITPGDPEGSEILARVGSTDPKEVMPPRATTKSLTSLQREILASWISAGAEYQPHWSLIPPRKKPLPRTRDQAWARNPIDSFVLAKLEATGLTPAPEASRPVLARRLAFDLTGLPPDPALVAWFVSNRSPAAYEELVDRLMASPHWGEHRARYWMDVARYADTNGYHFDNFRESWAYRDWVLGAFNRNLPFDQFTIEQLAGDLLPGATLDQRTASGFNRCNATTNEGGVIPEEYQVLYTRDRTETVSQVFMGLTAGCAVCHDHKFDPISQREFYELSAFFNNTTQPTMDGNVKDTPPTVFVPAALDRERWQPLIRERASVKSQLENRAAAARPDFDRWLASVDPKQLAARAPAAGLELSALDPAPDETSIREDFTAPQAGDFEKDRPYSYGAWIKIPVASETGSVIARMDDRDNYRGWDLWLEGDHVGTHLVNHWPDNAIKVVASEPIPKGVWTHVLVTYDGSGKGRGISIHVNGHKSSVDVREDNLTATIRASTPFKVGQRHAGSRLKGVIVRGVRLYNRAITTPEVAMLAGAARAAALAARPAGKRSELERDAVYGWWLESVDPVSASLRALRQDLDDEERRITSRGTHAQVMHERAEPAMAFVLFRGEYDKRKDQVKPSTPAALPAMPGDLPRNRLGLARWLVSADHPLTARVAVNRAWQEVLGTGLVSTTGDFGVTGDLPSHPELLDWLAVEFRESGWDLKGLYRLIVTSASYRQSAVVTPEKREKDQHNRLLSRGPRFRMDGEMLRDAALEASGLLVEKLGGPSVKPYQPEGVWEAVAMPESNTHFYTPDHGDKLYRRGLYTFWKRSAPPAALEVFNAPTRETCTVRRERTDTPLQALVTLNDPQFVEAARALAQRALEQGCDSTEARVDWIAKRLLARSFRPEERLVVANSLARLTQWYQSRPADAARLLTLGELQPDPTLDPATLAAWTMLTNEFMNLDEFLNK